MARLAHNQEVGSSNLSSATIENNTLVVLCLRGKHWLGCDACGEVGSIPQATHILVGNKTTNLNNMD